ncbi:sortilin-related receptor-like isoform X2 [Pomacea canaliculata]|uniref:sortilin-related receptor-like isoform X2 n=1 Tax=Pomacea canaliculata TaxID=400727 RepID=UPI000D73D5F1|nr:sortilin-related receptor-like isoform X2 [Pomacea canaliculata]
MGRRAAAAVFLLLCLCSNAQGKLRRFGAASKTLHVSHSGAYQEWDEKFVVIQADADFQETDEVQELLKRYRRDTKPADNVRSTVAPLNDTHTMLIVHWAGDNSNVIIALAKSAGIHGSPNSSVFVSRDYGASFTSITDQFAGASSIDKYFNSDLLNSHYVFTDVNRRCIFTTRDYARNIVSKCNLPFKPAVVSLSPSNADHILAFDPGSFFPDLYLSTDFGQSWRVIRHNVKAFFWGVDPYDAPNTLYVEEKRGYGGNIVLRSSTYFSDNLENVVIQGVEDFEVREEYMFATKKVHLFGSLQSSTYQFWVSYNRSEFINAMFPGRADNHTDYFVADASEDQVMVCVTHGNLNTSLYISDVLGSRFSLSLENIVYFSPTGANSDTWLSFYASESFADIHKVAGLRGIYIASQLVQDKKLSVENQRSLITYDKGGQWELLNAPTDRQLVNCTKQKDVLHFWNKDQARNCSLHVSQEFQRLYPGSLAQPLLSRESAPGILIASGSVGSSLLSEMNIFVSSDAGYSWHQVLDGSYLYAMADHGGILVAVQQFQPTDTIYYSVNEGQTWAQHKFVNNSIRVYGLLTEPGERTTIFSLFGSYTGAHSWILVQINMSAVLGSPCRKEDYKNWTLSENNPDAGCLLGRKVVYRRRIAHAVCYNGEDFVRFKELQNCLCTRNDFECDYGWRVDQNSKTSECVPDAEAGKVDGVPYPCPPGTYYQHSRGYRRVPGDTCTGGNETLYAPVQYSCPVQERSEFLLAAQRGKFLQLTLTASLLQQYLRSQLAR